MKSTKDYLENVEKLKTAIKNADAVLIGAGAGLSTSAGYTYSGERFFKYFADFHNKYGMTDMYSGGFYPFETKEEFWAYWSRYIYVNRYIAPLKPVYDNLLSLVCDKEYFVITTNVDHCFQRAGFNKERLFYTQGDYGLLQCSVPCHDNTYDNEELILKMVKEQKDMKIPANLIPHCPVCGAPMTTNLRADDSFVQDSGWNLAYERYSAFVNKYKFRLIVYLELGVGYNTPVIIKYPFWRWTQENENATYACVNYGEAVYPEKIQDRSICIDGDIGEVLNDLKK